MYGVDPRMGDPRTAYLHRMQYMQHPPHHPHPHQHPQQGFAPLLRENEEVALTLTSLGNKASDNAGARDSNDEHQQQMAAAAHNQAYEMQHHALNMSRAGMYPPMGAVYGFPNAAVGFDRMFAARDARVPVHHVPMEDPVVLTDVSFDDLIGDSKLISQKDRDLIPDALFVALAQLRPCKLQQQDRVGCYKTREIGFVGLCCKHCGGQPGFGRYFPNSVRSLAQTTTSQTILKHIGGKCRFCPPTIRKAVLELQRQQAHKEGMTSGRPRYGSRKIFFQRMWARLHNKKQKELEEEEGYVIDNEADTEATVPPKTEDLPSSAQDDKPAVNQEPNQDHRTGKDNRKDDAESTPKKDHVVAI